MLRTLSPPLYYYPEPDFEGDANFEIQVADGRAFFLPATGHFYKSVPTEVDHATAEAAAENSAVEGQRRRPRGREGEEDNGARRVFYDDDLIGEGNRPVSARVR